MNDEEYAKAFSENFKAVLLKLNQLLFDEDVSPGVAIAACGRWISLYHSQMDAPFDEKKELHDLTIKAMNADFLSFCKRRPQ